MRHRRAIITWPWKAGINRRRSEIRLGGLRDRLHVVIEVIEIALGAEGLAEIGRAHV